MEKKYMFKPLEPKKKSYIFSLTEKTNDQINKLSKSLNLTRSKVIEIVIKKFSEGENNDTKN